MSTEALSQLVGRSQITELLLHHFHFPLGLPYDPPEIHSFSNFRFKLVSFSAVFFFCFAAAFGQARPGQGLELVQCTKRFQKADRLNHRLTAHKDRIYTYTYILCMYYSICNWNWSIVAALTAAVMHYWHDLWYNFALVMRTAKTTIAIAIDVAR